MRISFVAGFGPITRRADTAHAFWRDGLGIAFAEPAPGYFTNDSLDGVKAFAMWPLEQAADSTFGTPEWPSDVPAPQAWLEFDVESAPAVAEAIEELRSAGHRVLRDAHEEPWGQTTARLLSPEGLLVGVTYTPWMHTPEERDRLIAAPRLSAASALLGPRHGLGRALRRLVRRQRLG